MSTNLIGKKIREARTDSHLSQKELSDALSVSEKAISSYESGRTVPSIKTLQIISKKTKKPLSFFTEEETDVQLTVAALLNSIDAQLAQIKKLLSK